MLADWFAFLRGQEVAQQLSRFKTVIAGDSWGKIAVPIIEAVAAFCV